MVFFALSFAVLSNVSWKHVRCRTLVYGMLTMSTLFSYFILTSWGGSKCLVHLNCTSSECPSVVCH
jgi:hypothetical protein